MSWTDEDKAAAIKAYKDRNPTAENSIEIVEEIATEMGQSVNGVRMILMKAEVYVKKNPATAAEKKGATTGDKPARVSKESAHADLTSAIESAGADADSEIISKLTGKAAVYFTAVIQKING